VSEKEPFITRWSRLKRDGEKDAAAQAREDVPQKSEERAPALPPVESLTPESDFSAFMAGGVQDTLKRAALKKLFSDPHFKGPDLFEPFSGDWTGGEAISGEMLATLNQARTVLFREEEKAASPGEAQEQGPAGAAEPKTEDDGAGKQDA